MIKYLSNLILLSLVSSFGFAGTGAVGPYLEFACSSHTWKFYGNFATAAGDGNGTLYTNEDVGGPSSFQLTNYSGNDLVYRSENNSNAIYINVNSLSLRFNGQGDSYRCFKLSK